MKIVLLTTQTTHHTYFAWKFAELFPFKAIYIESESAKPPFETTHPFEDEREFFERDTLLKHGPKKLEEIGATNTVTTMNAAESVNLLRQEKADVILVFGAGRLSPEVIGSSQIASLNLHGGHPEEYRGLDTHLWTVYHRDFKNLVTTLHYIDADLDTGDIVFQENLL